MSRGVRRGRFASVSSGYVRRERRGSLRVPRDLPFPIRRRHERGPSPLLGVSTLGSHIAALALTRLVEMAEMIRSRVNC